MKFRTTLVLMVVALGIAAYIWFYEQKQLSTDEREEKGKLVFSVKADDIDRIELVRDKDPVVCVRDKAGDWNLEKPLKYKADKSQVRGILSRLEGLKSERVIPAAEAGDKKAEEFGLKKPRLTARFRVTGKDAGLSIGEDTPLGESAYARVEGSKDVHVVAKSVYGALNKEVKDLRDHGVIEFEQADLSKVVITRGGKSLELAQDGETWKIASPVKATADPDKVGGLLRKVRNLRVRDFVDDAPKDLQKYGLAAPEADIVLRGKKDAPAGTILFGKEAEKGARYARTTGRDAVFTVGNDVMKDVVSDPGELRDTKVTRLDEAQVSEIRIEQGDRKLALAKMGEKWELKEPEKKEADENQPRELLKAVTGLAVSDFVADKAENPEKYGLGKGALALTLKTKDGREEKVLIGNKFARDKKVYLKREKGDEVLGVSAEILDRCATDPVRFFKKQVLDFNSADAKKITISDPKFRKTVCEKEGNDWRMIEPKKEKAETAAVAAILANISRLRAQEIVARSPKDLKDYSLDSPFLEAAIEHEKGGTRETTTLKIGRKAKDNTFYATLAGGDLVFTIPAYVEENLRKDLTAKPAPAKPAVPAPAPQLSPPAS